MYISSAGPVYKKLKQNTGITCSRANNVARMAKKWGSEGYLLCCKGKTCPESEKMAQVEKWQYRLMHMKNWKISTLALDSITAPPRGTVRSFDLWL